MMGYELPFIFGKRQQNWQSTGACTCVFLGRRATRVELLLCFYLVVLIDSYLISVVKDKKDKAT